jgi:creatinine amidohydrolase
VSTVHSWDELTRDEIAALAPGALVVLPVGSTEQHGPHLAAGTDALLAGTIARRGAELAARPPDVLVCPTLAYGASAHHLPFGGTLSLTVETFGLALRDLLASVAGAGFTHVLVLNGHGGNAAPCAIAVAEASRDHGIIAASVLTSDLVAGSDVPGPVRGHAGVFETSLVLALDPSLVRMELARPSPGGAARVARQGLVVADPGRWAELDGYTDNPSEASAELGETYLATCASGAAAAIEALADLRA